MLSRSVADSDISSEQKIIAKQVFGRLDELFELRTGLLSLLTPPGILIHRPADQTTFVPLRQFEQCLEVQFVESAVIAVMNDSGLRILPD